MLLSRGLTDRKQPVRECAQQLLCQWLQADAEGSIPALLHLLCIQQHEDAGLQAVSSGGVRISSGIRDAAAGCIGTLHRTVVSTASSLCAWPYHHRTLEGA